MLSLHGCHQTNVVLSLAAESFTMPYADIVIEKAPVPHSLEAYAQAYIERIKIKRESEQGIRFKYTAIMWFIDWCREREVDRLELITRPLIQRYQRHLHYVVGKNGKPLTIGAQRNRLMAIRAWFKYLMRENLILHNPTSDLDLPKKEKRLPKHTLTAAEAERILAQPDITTPLGIRDRAILEVFYSTGIRRQEMIDLAIQEVDRGAGVLAVRQGKGRKDRFIPIGDRAVQWVEKYLEDVRPYQQTPSSPDNLFLKMSGKALTPHPLGKMVYTYIQASGVEKAGRCHLFRHTMATLMLENGADLRFIQQMLGHQQLSTTEIYTRVAIHKLKAIHTETHPGKLNARDQQDALPQDIEAESLLDQLVEEAED